LIPAAEAREAIIERCRELTQVHARVTDPVTLVMMINKSSAGGTIRVPPQFRVLVHRLERYGRDVLGGVDVRKDKERA